MVINPLLKINKVIIPKKNNTIYHYMENEKNEDIQEEEELELPVVAEGEEDTTDWKELALKQQGINKRLKTKMEKAKAKKEEAKETKTSEKPELNKTEFDYGQKAYINQTLGVDLKNEKEVALVNDYINAGKTLDDLLTNKHFNNDLKDLQEATKAKNAIPSGSKRSATSDKTATDYWMGKDFKDVPQEHRAEVLKKTLEGERKQSMYATK